MTPFIVMAALVATSAAIHGSTHEMLPAITGISRTMRLTAAVQPFSTSLQNSLTVLTYEDRGMAKGTVKWFNAAKGYGFIRPDEGDKDAFVHITEVERSGMGILSEGQRVRFTPLQQPRGLKAVDLMPGE